MVRNAAPFSSATSVESIGDYTAGPSHVMPTGGNALRLAHRRKTFSVTSVISLRQELVEQIGPPLPP
jgi:histidinol dehydrogenase